MSHFQKDDFPEDDYYIARMKDILEGYPRLGPLQHPSKLLEHVYIGNQDNADNLDLLQALEITHVLNCAGTRTFDLTRSPYRPDTGIVGFLMMPAEDYEEFDIMQYFMDAIIFLDKVKKTGGRALVHCNLGVNRCGAIVACYLMVYQKRPLLKVIEDLKSKRSLILQNEGFRRQLVRFARCRGLLDVPDRPPQKLTLDGSYFRGASRESNVSGELPETTSEAARSASNGHSNHAEEASRDHQTEATKSETNGGGPLSKETLGEQNAGGGAEERRNTTHVQNFNSLGKYAGYESDLLHSDNYQKERLHSSASSSRLENIRDDLEKTFSKMCYLDLGSYQPSTKVDHLSLNRSVSPLSFTSSTDLDLNLATSNSRPLENTRSTSEKRLNSKLSALSLELPRTRPPALLSHHTSQHLTSDLLYPAVTSLDHTRDHYPSFRLSGIDKIVSPVPSLSQRLSRESSVSDTTNSLYASLDGDDFSGKNVTHHDKPESSYLPLSNSHLDCDEYLRNYRNTAGKTFSASERFVSSVKPRSYYKKSLAPHPSRHPVDVFESEGLKFAENVRSGFERPARTRPYYERVEGMLFVPYLASSKSASTIHRNGSSSYYDALTSRPLSYADGNYTTETSSYARNTPYNRMSLSELDGVGSYDFPTRTSSSYYPSSSAYRPQSSSYRSTSDYDDAVDEYSDLLDASLGRSSALGYATKCRARSGASTGSRKFYRY